MDDAHDDALAKIWEGDLFNRRPEADALQAYIESVGGRDLGREDAKAYTIAVDADYGIGKTYFLKRLAKQLGQTHPVAFIDAWADDLADEPLIALASTFKEAFDPLIKTDPTVKSRLSTVLGALGDVSKVLGWGLVKKGVSIAAGEAAANEAVDLVKGALDDSREDIAEAVRDISNEVLEHGKDAITRTTPAEMDEKIHEFRLTKANIKHLKVALNRLIESLSDTRLTGPVIIVIDELDRCRPTYAVKVLEEIKHLFDVQGLVFVFGINGDQLSRAMTAPYGSAFNGSAYLDRFIDRRYKLTIPNLTPLLKGLFIRAGISEQQFKWPHTVNLDDRQIQFELSEIVASYMSSKGLGPRQAFAISDILHLCASIANNRQRLILPYLMPMILDQFSGEHESFKLQPERNFTWRYAFGGQQRIQTMSPVSLASQLEDFISNEITSAMTLYSGNDLVATNFFDDVFSVNQPTNVYSPKNYKSLLGIVGKLRTIQ